MLTIGKQRETSIIVNFMNSLAKYTDEGEAKRNINHLITLLTVWPNTLTMGKQR